MALVPLSELTTPLTVAHVKETIYDVLASVGTNTTSWKPGAVARTIIAAVAILVAAMSTLIAELANSAFLPLARGSWLTLLAKHVYGVDRVEATFAVGSIQLDNTAGGSFSYAVDELVVINSDTGKTYRNTEAFSLAPLETGKIVAVQAVEAGSESTALAGEIDDFENPPAGVTVTNPTALIGADEESDPALRSRCLDAIGAASPNGPGDAYAYFAKTATKTDGTTSAVTKTRVIPDGVGGVTVYMATASGAVTGTVGDLSTDLGASDDAVQRNAVPITPTAASVSATAKTIPISYEIWIYNTVKKLDSEITAAIKVKLEDLFAELPIGGDAIAPPAAGKLYVSKITAAIRSAWPDHIFRVDVSAPAADQAIAVTEVAALGTITALVNQIKPEA